MNAMNQLRVFFVTHVFAKIPKKDEQEFAISLYKTNLPRFAVMSAVLVLMDAVSLFAYGFFYVEMGVFYGAHVGIHIVKIVLMGLLFFVFSKWRAREYVAPKISWLGAETWFLTLHGVLELMLFASGPRDLGALVRFLAAPFIMGTVAVMKQQRVAVMNFCSYLVCSLFLLFFTVYSVESYFLTFVVNVWLVVFFLTFFIASVVYSGCVNSYMRNKHSHGAKNSDDSLWMAQTITLLPGRQQFHIDINKLLVEQSRGCVVLFDISNFKSVNGIYGHGIGDKTLQKVSAALKKMVPQNAQMYHNAVDQFLLVTPGACEADTSEMVNRIQQFFSAYDIMVEGLALKIGFHVGALAYGYAHESLDDLMVNLDIALQRSKQDHRHSFRLFSQRDKTEYLARINLEKELAESVRNNFLGFALHYQPLFALTPVRCKGAEALLRWSDKSGEFVTPLAVIPVLERSRLITKAGNWILREACRQCGQWIAAGGDENFFVHVNLSPAQIEKNTFVGEVLAMLKEFAIQPKNLVLELTESSFVSDTALAVDVLNGLRQNGIHISVDDFGTGYSSLSYLRNMPADQIKIDRSFLIDLETDESARRILRSVTDLTKGMGFEVVVEGAETEAQVRFLQGSQVDLLQGFLLGRPVPANVFAIQWLSLGKETPPPAEQQGADAGVREELEPICPS